MLLVVKPAFPGPRLPCPLRLDFNYLPALLTAYIHPMIEAHFKS